MSDEAGRLVFSRDPSGTFIDGMVFGTSGGGENANLEVLCALPYELVRPHASASVLGPLVGVGNVKRLSLSVKYLDGEISVGRYDRVSGFLVEQARALVGGDAEYQFSAVVCRPGVAERLDLRSEAFAPMLPDDRDPFDDGCMLGESLSYLCGMDPARPGAVWTPLVPVRYMSVSATQRAGWMRAAPIRRSCPHTPMYVGLIVPSSCLTTAGTL